MPRTTIGTSFIAVTSAALALAFVQRSAVASNITVLNPQSTKDSQKPGGSSVTDHLGDSKTEHPTEHLDKELDKQVDGHRDDQVLSPGLVPYSDEVTICGEADFSEKTLGLLKGKCLLVNKDCHANRVGLYRGRILFNCTNDIHLKTPQAELDIRRGAIVYVYSTGESFLILNFHDHHRRDVMLTVDGKNIEIPPGRELLVTRYGNLKFDEARLCPGIWYRSVFEHIAKPDLKVYETQFSTVSAFWVFPSVHKLIQKDKKASEKLIKTYAAVLRVSHDPQAFRPNVLQAYPTNMKVVSARHH